MSTAEKQLLTHMIQKYNRLVYTKGKLVVRAGEQPDCLYFVRTGTVRQYSVSPNGEELTVFLYSPGNVFFMPWFAGVKENNYYFEALTKVVVWQVSKRALNSQMEHDPAVRAFLLNQAWIGLYALMVHMESLVYGNAREKVASVLVMLSKWYGRVVNGDIQIRLALPHRLLATMVGMARETTSAAISELRKEGLVTARNQRITVCNLPGLREAAGAYLAEVDLDERMTGWGKGFDLRGLNQSTTIKTVDN